MTRKRTRPFRVEYRGHGRIFPASATAEDVEDWKKSIRDHIAFQTAWHKVPEALRDDFRARLNAAERRAWERDHPGTDYPEHMCAVSRGEERAYWRWWSDQWLQSETYRGLMREQQALIANETRGTPR